MNSSTNIPDPASTTIAHMQDEAAVHVAPPSRSSGLQLLWRGTINKICLAVIAFYILVGVISLLPSPADIGLGNVPLLGSVHSFDELIDYKYHPDEAYAPPSWSFVDSAGHKHYSPAAWFGFDFSGHSVFWQVFYGARTALLITVLTSAIILVIGTSLGLIAGYFGGWIDDLITWVYSVVNTVPWLLLVIAVGYTLQQNAALDEPSTVAPTAFARIVHNFLPQDLVIVILSLGFTDWVGLCRLIRGEALKLRDSDMVAAGRAVGLSELRIIFRHILPNVSHLIIISFTLGAVGYLQVEVVLAFLGIGVSTKPSWGNMINDAKLTLLRGVWWEVTAATAAIFIICMALTILGDALRDALDPKLRGRD